MGDILVTGASGFIGKNLVNDPFFQSATSLGRTKPNNTTRHIYAALDSAVSYEHHLKGVDTVIHLAGRAHITSNDAVNEHAQMTEINTKATLNLAQQCIRDGVKHFIFLSSAKVLGEESILGRPFHHLSEINPCGPYAISKANAENGLVSICKNTSMSYTIIRPPLIYGPGVKGNIQSLQALVEKRLPIPLGNIYNRKSMISIYNLISLIKCCVSLEVAQNKIFLASDGDDLSTPQLTRLIADSLKKRAWIVDLPLPVLKYFLISAGRRDWFSKLTQSFEVNIDYTMSTLGWKPKPIEPNDFN